MNQKEIEQLAMLLEKAKESLAVDGLKPEFVFVVTNSEGRRTLRGTTVGIFCGFEDLFLEADDGSPVRKSVSIN